MDINICKIVIIGDVDHGKSTLIGRLLLDTNSLSDDFLAQVEKTSKILGRGLELPFITDQFKEEREKSMTIDTTQFFFRDGKRKYVIIDAPGHEQLLKNTFSGITQADIAVLIIDVKEGVTQQTQRHAFLLSMLGFKDIIIAINKMDLVGYKEEKFNAVKLELLELFKKLRLKPLSIIPICALHGIHITKASPQFKWFKGTFLLQALRYLKNDADIAKKPLRLPIQDVYRMNNHDLPVGKIVSGQIKTGQTVLLLPFLTTAKVRSIKIYNKHKKQAQAEENIGVTLNRPIPMPRGTIIANQNARPIKMFQALVFWLSQRPFRINETFTLRCATQQIDCFSEKILKRIDIATLEILEENTGKLENHEVGLLILKTEKPIVVDNFSFIPEMGRFTIEKDDDVQAAGIVTNNQSFEE